MPQVRKNEETIEVNLPSYGTEDPATVLLKRHITVSDAISVEETLTEKEKALALLTKSIVSWNLTDNGEALPITEENVRALEVSDFIALMNSMSVDGIKELNDQKKSA